MVCRGLAIANFVVLSFYSKEKESLARHRGGNCDLHATNMHLIIEYNVLLQLAIKDRQKMFKTVG